MTADPTRALGYRNLQHIGDAPLGPLYRAQAESTGDPILLKAIAAAQLAEHPDLRREVAALTRFYRPELPALLTVEETAGTLWLASEWPPGQSIERYLREHSIDRPLLLRWTRQLADQLSDVHAAGVLHRSIGPLAVGVREEDAFLTGFSLTSAGAQPATLVAPELGTGGPLASQHSAVSDLFALGRLLLSVADGSGCELEETDPLRRALERCSAEAPDDRWPDAASFELAVRRIESPPEPLAFPQPVPDPRPKAAPAPQSSATAGSPAAPPTAAEPASGRSRRLLPVAATLAAAALLIAGFLAYRSLSAAENPAGAPAASQAPAPPAVPTAAQTPSPAEGKDEDEDEALTVARSLLGGSPETLFGGAADGEAGAPPETDGALAASLRADLASLSFGEDPRGRRIARSLYGENPVTGNDNPLLDPDLRQRWLAMAIRNVGDREAIEHLTAESDRLRHGDVTLAEWYEHVNSCKKVCNLVVLGLLQEHIRRVQELPHELVVFDLGSERLSGAETDKIRRAAGTAAESAEILLIGRASRIGNREYNRELSRRRVDSVKRQLTELGVADGRIETLWLGYEPPQLSDEIAARYAIDPGLDEERRNQSVLVVLHPPPGRDT